jgi:hypothetical protein
MCSGIADAFDVTPAMAAALLSRANGERGAPTLRDMADAFPDVEVPSVTAIADVRAALLLRIERIVRSVSAAVLADASSALINDGDRAVQRLAARLDDAVATIRGSGDDGAMTVLRRELERIPGGAVTAAIEGIVFVYDGKAYKLTGGFQPISTLLRVAEELRGADGVTR